MKKAADPTPTPSQTTRKRGRPDAAAGEEALARLYHVAYVHFIVSGVEDANMLAIAREAGVSRQMIHNRFGNKQQFFDAVVRTGEDHLENKFNVTAMPATDDPWIIFNHLGNAIANIVLNPGSIDIFRVMNMAAYRHPEISATHEASLNKAYTLFAKLLKRAGKAADIEIADIKGVSRDFLALIHGFTLPVIQGRRPRPPAQVQAREISAIVDRFLRGAGFTKPRK